MSSSNHGFLGMIWWFPKIVVPQNGWFIMENPIKMDDLRYPYFWKHQFSWRVTLVKLKTFPRTFQGDNEQQYLGIQLG